MANLELAPTLMCIHSEDGHFDDIRSILTVMVGFINKRIKVVTKGNFTWLFVTCFIGWLVCRFVLVLLKLCLGFPYI